MMIQASPRDQSGAADNPGHCLWDRRRATAALCGHRGPPSHRTGSCLFCEGARDTAPRTVSPGLFATPHVLISTAWPEGFPAWDSVCSQHARSAGSMLLVGGAVLCSCCQHWLEMAGCAADSTRGLELPPQFLSTCWPQDAQSGRGGSDRVTFACQYVSLGPS